MRSDQVRWADLAAVVWTVVLGVLLLSPGGSVEQAPRLPFRLPPGSDKVVHALVFGIETWLLWRAFRHRAAGAAVVWAAGLAGALALVTEGGQHWIATRHTSLGDLAANATGIALVAWWLSRHQSDGAPAVEKR